MAYQRGDIVEIPFLIPHHNKTENHPAVIISNQQVHDNEQIYICVMITHSSMNDIFSFELKPEMFSNPDKMPSGQAKAQLIAYVPESHIIRNAHTNGTRMKSLYVDKLVSFVVIIALTED